MEDSCVAAVLTLPRGAFYIMLTALSVGPREHVPSAPPVSMCATHLLLFLSLRIYSLSLFSIKSLTCSR